MGVTSDPNDPRLGRGVDTEPIDQHQVYLVLSDEERAKGFVRPFRSSYIHVGPPGPRFELVDLDDEQRERHGDRYVKFEPHPEEMRPSLGTYWTQEQLDKIDKGCGVETHMGRAIAETYARSPTFYGATYCVGCRMHLPVGERGEFIWADGSGQRVGT